MIKEIKILIFLLFTTIFFYLSIIFYISDKNKKNSYRMMNNLEKKINLYSKSLPIIFSDTEHIVEYVEKDSVKNKDEFKFWNLITNDQ